MKHREARSLLEQISKDFGSITELSEKDLRIEAAEVNGEELIFLNAKPSIIKIGIRLLPTLVFNRVLESLPRVVVDMNAIPRVCNGADIMAPGVRRVEGEFPVSSVIVVTDDRYGKFLAVGEALKGSDDLKTTRHGKVVLNRHYVGDKIWNAISKITA